MREGDWGVEERTGNWPFSDVGGRGGRVISTRLKTCSITILLVVSEVVKPVNDFTKPDSREVDTLAV